MNGRYENTEKKKTFDGKEVLRSKIYPNIPLRDDDVYVMTETGDRLDSLAWQYYENPTLWWIIAAANNIHDAPLGLKEGTILRIPQNYLAILAEFTN